MNGLLEEVLTYEINERELAFNPKRMPAKERQAIIGRGTIAGMDASKKVEKGNKFGFVTGIIYLHPHEFTYGGKKVNTCPMASAQCSALCLFEAGMGRIGSTKASRDAKTVLYYENRAAFLKMAADDIDALEKRANTYTTKQKDGIKQWMPCMRPNGTSDLPALAIELMEMTKGGNVQCYDYTKIPITKSDRRLKYVETGQYQLTFSRSELNWHLCRQHLNAGINVAVPFYNRAKTEARKEYERDWRADYRRRHPGVKPDDMPAPPKRAEFNYLPEEFQGYEVIDGDIHDLRFLDDGEYEARTGHKKKKGLIVGLTYKEVTGYTQPPNFMGAKKENFVVLLD